MEDEEEEGDAGGGAGDNNAELHLDEGNLSARDKIKKYFDGDTSRKKIAPNSHNLEEFSVMN